MRKSGRGWWGLFGLLLPVAAGASSMVEVVQSVPLETSLAVPGIRQTQAVWLEMIQGARRTLDLEQFYVSDQAGQALQPVLQAIQDAATRGVQVRLLVDSSFYKTYPDSVNLLAGLKGFEVRTVDFSPLGGIQHAKFFVVDGARSFVGSQNFDWRALSHIHEIGLAVSDAQVASDLGGVFERDWASGKVLGRADPEADGFGSLYAALTSPSVGVSVVASPAQANPAGLPASLSAITGQMDLAAHSLQVQVMEYSTAQEGRSGARWSVLDQAIRRAAARGVQVQLMVDVSCLKKSKSELASLAALKNVQVRAVTIPQYSGGVIEYARLIHSKYMVVDGGASGWVGSENWGESYFMNTRDVGLMVSSPDVAAQLEQVFERVWTSPYAAGL